MGVCCADAEILYLQQCRLFYILYYLYTNDVLHYLISVLYPLLFLSLDCQKSVIEI